MVNVGGASGQSYPGGAMPDCSARVRAGGLIERLARCSLFERRDAARTRPRGRGRYDFALSMGRYKCLIRRNDESPGSERVQEIQF